MNNEKEDFKVRFKDRIYQWVLKLLKFIEILPKDNVSRNLANQLVWSGTSVLGNYVEAHSSNSKRDFAYYFRVSLRSTNESRVWLTLLKDMKKGIPEKINHLIAELEEISAVLASSLITLKKKKDNK